MLIQILRSNNITNNTNNNNNHSFIIIALWCRSVNELRGPYPHHCSRAAELLLKKRRSGGDPLAALVSDLTGPRLEPQTSPSRDERVVTRSNEKRIVYTQ